MTPMPKAASGASGPAMTDDVIEKVRVPFIQRATLTRDGAEEPLFLVDLGVEGAFAERPEPLPVGEAVGLQFRLPGNEIPLCRALPGGLGELAVGTPRLEVAAARCRAVVRGDGAGGARPAACVPVGLPSRRSAPVPPALATGRGGRAMSTIGSLVANREVYTLSAEQTVREAALYMADRRVGAVSVLSDMRLVGILSERDIMSRVVAAGADPDRTRVADVMTRDLVVAAPSDSHEEGLRKMKQAGCRHLPVVEAGRLVGMIAQRDLLQVDLTAKDEEIRWLNAYVHFIPPAREGTS